MKSKQPKTPQQEILSYISGTDIETEFHDLRQAHDEYCWKVADLIARTYSLMRAEGKEFTALEVCSAVNVILNDEVGSFTLYNYWLVGKLITNKKDRELYSILPFSHLLFARQYSESTGNDWKLVLDYDLKAMDKNNGRPISKAKLEIQFNVFTDEEPPYYDESSEQGTYNPLHATQNASDMPNFHNLIEAVKYIERHFETATFKNATQSVLASRIAALCRKFLVDNFDNHSETEMIIIDTKTKH